MAGNSNRQKRPRTTEQSESGHDGSSYIFRHDDFWFYDGNIILLCSNDAGFKVHKSLLDKKLDMYSGAFEDGSLQFERRFHGVEVMDMTAHRAADVHTLVTCLYEEPCHGIIPSDEECSMSFILSVLRVSAKFGAPEWQKRAERWINFYFPSELDSYGKSLDKAWEDFNPLLVAEIVSSLIPRALPTALYETSLLPIEDVLEDALYLKEKFKISPAIRRMAIVFRDRYRAWLSRIVVPLRERVPGIDIPGHTCTNACSDARRDLEHFYHSAVYNILVVDPMDTVESLGGSCRRCCAYYGEIHGGLRKALWNELPRWAGRQTWNEFPRRANDAE